MDFTNAPPVYHLVAFLANSQALFLAMSEYTVCADPRMTDRAAKIMAKSRVLAKLNDILVATQPQLNYLVVDLLTQFKDETEEVVKKLGAKLTALDNAELEVERLTKLVEEKDANIRSLESQKDNHKRTMDTQDKRIQMLTTEKFQQKNVIDCLGEAGAELEKRFEVEQAKNRKLSSQLANAKSLIAATNEELEASRNSHNVTSDLSKRRMERVMDLKNELALQKEASSERIEHLLDMSARRLKIAENLFYETCDNQQKELKELKESSDVIIKELKRQLARKSENSEKEKETPEEILPKTLHDLERFNVTRTVETARLKVSKLREKLNMHIKKETLKKVKESVLAHSLGDNYVFE